MIPVAKARKPANFDETVRQPGLRAIAEMVGKPSPYPRTAGRPFKKIAHRERDIPAEKFPDYWTDILDDLMEAYKEVCAYACFRIHPVTGARSADHFAPKSKKWRDVYKWSNYRLCSSRMNARKNDFCHVLDPFRIQQGWFRLELLGFQVVPDPGLPKPTRDEIQRTIDLLGLNDFRRDREKDAERYWNRDYSLKILKAESPFVAYELYRQGRLNPGDIW
ncbi:hypothetical protein G3N57_17910 [Paraburkholderia sp. Se-20369]|nr:hypothetical protein [Paraburkholderia sp. Se-20369]